MTSGWDKNDLRGEKEERRKERTRLGDAVWIALKE
jgi:hypothetical protein